MFPCRLLAGRRERDAILAARRAEARRSAPKRQQQQEAAPAAVLPQDQPRAGAGKQTEANTNTGFIPFYGKPAGQDVVCLPAHLDVLIRGCSSGALGHAFLYFLRPPSDPRCRWLGPAVRKQMGGDKAPGGKRLSGEVVRTLESIYDRTPFPSADMLR